MYGWLEQLADYDNWWDGEAGSETAATVAAELLQQVNASVLQGCEMIGDVRWIARSVAAHELVCDGSVFDRVDYPLLYSSLDSVYLLDADTFMVPDLIGKFARGAAAPGSEGGADTVTLTVDQMPSHSHLYADAGLPELPVVSPGELVANAFSGASSTSSTGGGEAHENRPPYHELTPVIVAGYPTAG